MFGYIYQKIQYLLVSAILLSIVSCNPADQNKGEQKLTIVTTTGMIKDAVKHIVGDSAEVIGLMGPGVDPHLYKATQGDLGRLRKADLIVYNGLHLEGKMGEVLEKLSHQKPVLTMAEGLPDDQLLSPPAYKDAHDPHIWFDVSLWRSAVKNLSGKMQELYPDHASYFQANTEAYLNKLDELHKWVQNKISTIPREQRVLITAHDAFEYFGEAYDIEVKGLQGISTVSEFGLRDITNMVDFIVERNIKAVFVESSVSEKALKAVVEGVKEKGHDIQIGGTLYSDAMGAEGTPEGTYTGMVRANVQTMVSSLK